MLSGNFFELISVISPQFCRINVCGAKELHYNWLYKLQKFGLNIIDVLPYSLNNVYFIPVYIRLGNHAHYRKQNLLYTLNRWPERIWIDVWFISKYLQIWVKFHMKNILHINLSYHRSELVSYPNGSAPGGCKIEMQTRPSG